MVLGLTHNWFGIVTPADALGARKLFRLSWLLVFLGTSQGSGGPLPLGRPVLH